MNLAEKRRLEAIACRVRMHIIEGTFNAKSGHPGGSLSAADLLTYLYFKELDVRPDEPNWPDRDRFVLSKGHAAPVLYGALAERGFFPVEEIKNLRKVGGMLQGHPSMKSTPGVEMSTGSLGQGISTAVGMAIGAKLSKKDYRVYALCGDGESQEGQVWEALMSAAHYKLDNFVAIIDYNNLQIDGRVSDVMGLEPLDKKLEAFGLFTQVIDGHDFDAMEAAFEKAALVKGEPSAIVIKTIKGRGVSFMEDNAGWHGKGPNADEYERAMAELEARYTILTGGAI